MLPSVHWGGKGKDGAVTLFEACWSMAIATVGFLRNQKAGHLIKKKKKNKSRGPTGVPFACSCNHRQFLSHPSLCFNGGGLGRSQELNRDNRFGRTWVLRSGSSHGLGFSSAGSSSIPGLD